MACWLVTGGCGFIGSHLVEALLGRGDRVCVIDDLSTGRRHREIAGAELLVGDVADRALAARALAKADGCFHLAAVASVERCNQDWLGSHRTNLTGTLTVFDAARGRGRGALPVVYASSAAVYGDNPQTPLSETAATHPLSAYGADKLACELHGRIAWSVHGIPNVGLRFFNVYGPRQDPQSPYSGVISIFLDRMRAGHAIDIHGDGRQTRDFIYVGDVVAFLIAAMTDLRAEARVFNVCTGRATSITGLAETIGEIGGRPVTLRHDVERRGDIRTSVGDPAAATAAFRLTADTGLKDGLRQMMDAATDPAAEPSRVGNDRLRR